MLPAASGAKPAPGSDLAKLDSVLRELRSDKARGKDVRRTARLNGRRLAPGGKLVVDVYVKGDVGAAASALRIEGMDVDATTADPFKIVEGRLPIDAADEVAALDRVRAVISPAPGGTDTGGTLSEGDASHNGPQARALGPTGAGVNMGVISDSIDQVAGGVSDSQASGDLPANVTVLKDATGGSDEGRAMSEIVYDEAPGIPKFLFASGVADGLTATGPVGRADSINQLVANGARIIADDVFMLNEPFFQDGVVATAVDNARGAGVAYFASAGNRARQSWEGNYVDDSGANDFGSGDNFQTVVSVPAGAFISIVIQWDEPFGAVSTDLDAYLFRSPDLVSPVDSSTDANPTTGIPSETVSFVNPGPAADFLLEIDRFAGTASPFMKYIAGGDFGSFAITEHATNSDTINPDAASATGSLATAAIDWSESGLNDPEDFSSRGPKVRIFGSNGNRFATPQVRRKPQIAAADGVSTSVPGFATFFGTSAATPSAAGLGALILSAKPSNTADDVYAIMQEPINSIDCTLGGRPDLDCGMGFVLADKMVRRALDATPPAVTNSVSPAVPNGKNGFYLTNVNVSFVASDPGSPITSQTGCAPVTINTDTPPAGTTLTCVVRSTGGTTTTPVTIKRDATKPTISKLKAAKKFRVKKKGKASKRAPKGTSIRFNLSEAASVSITIQQKKRGRFKKRRTFKRNGRAGGNKVPFSGRIKVKGKARSLKPGSYRVSIKATDPAGNTSAAKKKKFKIVKK